VVLYQLSYDPIQWAVNLDAETGFVKVFFRFEDRLITFWQTKSGVGKTS
jgi:hypothetical protein